MHGAGRKREWQPMESSADRDDHHHTQAQGYIHSNGGGGRNAHGEAIEKEMKKLRLAHDYDDEPMDVEGGGDAIEERNHNYAAKNNLLRECHYLRQLRKFQSESVRERASYFERRGAGMDAQTSYLHEPRY